MKRSLVFLLFFFVSASVSAQILKPAKWSFKASKASPKVGETVNIIFTATIDNGWYLYSSKLVVDGPMPTEATFTKNGSFEAVGSLIPVNPKEKYDEIWEGKVHYFTEKAVFVQKVKILKVSPTVEGTLNYQTCTTKDGSCIPNKEKFKLSL